MIVGIVAMRIINTDHKLGGAVDNTSGPTRLHPGLALTVHVVADGPDYNTNPEPSVCKHLSSTPNLNHSEVDTNQVDGR